MDAVCSSSRGQFVSVNVDRTGSPAATVLRDFTPIDGTGSDPVPGSALMDGGRITCVGSTTPQDIKSYTHDRSNNNSASTPLTACPGIARDADLANAIACLKQQTGQ